MWRAPVNQPDDSSGSQTERVSEPTSLALIVQGAMDGWRIHNDPAAVSGPTMAQTVAETVWASGYVRVTEDPETVRKVTNMLAGVDGWEIRWPRDGEKCEDILLRYMALARAALAALRGGEQR